MGLQVDRERFDVVEYQRFSERLRRSLEALEGLLARPDFGAGPASLGAELELFLVDGDARPLPLNQQVLRETVDPRLTVELDRFNLECNLRPTPLAGRPFHALEEELRDAVAEVERAARAHRGRAAVIGILPTLRESDLQRSAMTDQPRYRALSAALRQLRRGPFRLRIEGEEPLDATCDDVTFEGANTSLQVHLKVPPDAFGAIFDAAQLACAPVLAAATNSPSFLGHDLWEETRVAVFKQAVDARGPSHAGRSRVAFGTGWAREGALGLFRRNVEVHAPLLPILSEEDPLDVVRAGGVPQLEELRLHQGTVWHWNRAVYDPVQGGHLRIEMRALPAGPSVVDMVSNAAFLVGLALGLAPDVEAWKSGTSFESADRNFYRAAQRGLGAELAFPSEPGAPEELAGAAALALRLLPIARSGLVDAGVAPADAEGSLERMRARIVAGQTGARWQRAATRVFELRRGRPAGLAMMLEHYLVHAADGEPVHHWPLPQPDDALPVRRAPTGAAVPERVEDFLRGLGGPCALRVAGRDRTRTRAVVTLLHGNEPSGVRAVHAFLREETSPAVDALFVLGAPEAALAEPPRGLRQLPGARDLNRCFRPPWEGPEAGLARSILALLREACPEALVDLHNNTGRSLPYGVGPRAGEPELGLMAGFADRYVHSDLKLGALVEATAKEFPSIVVECGRAGAPAADAVARSGLERFLGASRLPHADPASLQVLTDPIRVEVAGGVRLAVGETAQPGVDFTVAAELDRHNFDALPAGHAVGWLRPEAPWPLRARRGDGAEVSRELFALTDGVLHTARPCVPIMITNDPGIAVGDCLFYVVTPR